jgi:hypothetical protein
MSDKLMTALRLTDEEYAEAFERYANAFLVDDYPELDPLGGKKDQGMDARVVNDETGKPELVVQSCVSPAGTARTKILNTIEKLKSKMPREFVYCTPAAIGTLLDETERELRKDHKVTLKVRDGPWFVQRHQTSRSRAALSEAYARGVLEPIVRDLDPDKLYSEVLSDREQRIAVQYLEALNIDRGKDSNLTNGIFDSLVACVIRDSDPDSKAYTEGEIVSAICAMFPDGHGPRIREIVPGRIRSLGQKKAIHFNSHAGGYVLSFPYREKVRHNIREAQERELGFIAALSAAVRTTAVDRGIDYDFPADAIVESGHQCVLWYLREQGKSVSDASSGLMSILNAEKLVEMYLEKNPLPQPKGKGKKHVTRDMLMDLLPHALYITLRSKDVEIAKHLRAKADLFIIHAFMQVTPDVQAACRKLLGGDILYLDTTVLIRCIAEYYSPADQRPLLHTLQGARKMGYRLRTWRPYIAELVSHLKGPIVLEWLNHYKSLPTDQMEDLLRTAPTLIAVFHRYVASSGGNLERIVEEIIGKTNEHENAIEFLMQLFNIETQDLPASDGDDEALRTRVWGVWLENKKKHHNMSDDRFELLVRNDVNAYVALVKLRRQNRPQGANYGYKTWYLTFDRMPWRIAKVLFPQRDALHEVAMSYSFLMNSVAALVNVGAVKLPDEILPATTVLDETEMVPSELRAAYQEVYVPNEKPFLRERKLRDLAHQLKSYAPLNDEPIGPESKIEILPNEEF